MLELRPPKPYGWTEYMEKDFLELKAEFSAGRIQAYPDFDSDEPFILTTDWSSLNIAGVLSQKQEGVERFLDTNKQQTNKQTSQIYI